MADVYNVVRIGRARGSVVYSTVSLIALCVATGLSWPDAAIAACPVGVVTTSVTLAPGDVCNAAQATSSSGIITIPTGAAIVTDAASPPQAPVWSTFGSLIEFTGGSFTQNVATPMRYAALAQDGATITFTSGTVTVFTNQSGFNASASLYADDPGSVINGAVRPTATAINGVDDTAAIRAVGGGHIELTNGFVAEMTGMNSSAVGSVYVGSFIDATHNSQVTVNSTGPFAQAILMFAGGLVKVDNTTEIQVNGPGAGIKIDSTVVPDGMLGPGIVINLNSVIDPATGLVSIGLWSTKENNGINGYVAIPSVVSADDLTVTGAGTRQLGLFAQAGSTINLTNSSITINGGGGSGAAAAMEGVPLAGKEAGGIINVTNTTLLANGPATSAVRARTGTAAEPNRFHAIGGSITTETAPAIAAQGGFLEATLDGVPVVGGGGRLINSVFFEGLSSVANLTATSGTTMSGDAFADATSILNMSLQTDTHWTGAALNVTNIDVDGTSLWTMTGNSTVSEDTSNAGVIDYVPPIGDPTQLGSYKTLSTVNYIGNGGTIVLNTFLGDDSAPSDRLVINGGTATGTTTLVIHNTTGPGALTLADGILVVDAQNGATTVPGAFTLGNRVAAGAFEYGLFRGGVSNAESWFLRSEQTGPVIRPEVPVDTVLPALANRLGLGMIGTYHDRIGEDYPDPVEKIWCKDPAQDYRCAPTPEQNSIYAGTGSVRRNALWGRIFGETGDVDFGNSVDDFEDNGPSYDFDLYGLQAGVDLLRRRNDNGTRDVAGLFAGYGHISADVDTVLGGDDAGNSDINGYSFGGYWTRLGEEGWYVDAVLQGTYYDANTSSKGIDPFPGEDFDTDGWGFAASLEGGYPIDLGDGYALEPQAQLVYQHIELDDGEDQFGRIDFDPTDALYGRLGARLTKDWQTESGRWMTAWARADVWSVFGETASTTFSDLDGGNKADFDTDLGGTWMRVGPGISAEMTENVSLFASGDYNFGLSEGDFDSWSGRVGFKVKW